MTALDSLTQARLYDRFLLWNAQRGDMATARYWGKRADRAWARYNRMTNYGTK